MQSLRYGESIGESEQDFWRIRVKEEGLFFWYQERVAIVGRFPSVRLRKQDREGTKRNKSNTSQGPLMVRFLKRRLYLPTDVEPTILPSE